MSARRHARDLTLAADHPTARAPNFDEPGSGDRRDSMMPGRWHPITNPATYFRGHVPSTMPMYRSAERRTASFAPPSMTLSSLTGADG